MKKKKQTKKIKVKRTIKEKKILTSHNISKVFNSLDAQTINKKQYLKAPSVKPETITKVITQTIETPALTSDKQINKSKKATSTKKEPKMVSSVDNKKPVTTLLSTETKLDRHSLRVIQCAEKAAQREKRRYLHYLASRKVMIANQNAKEQETKQKTANLKVNLKTTSNAADNKAELKSTPAVVKKTKHKSLKNVLKTFFLTKKAKKVDKKDQSKKQLLIDQLWNKMLNEAFAKSKKLKEKQCQAIIKEKQAIKKALKTKTNFYNDNKSIYAVELNKITKTFNKGQFFALKNTTLKVKKNTIHAIVGENGAGKTTLMSVLFGQFKADSGEVYVNGIQSRFKTSLDATNAGIGMVHQHFKLVNVYSLLDNIILGAETTKYGFIDRNESRKKIEAIAKKYNLRINLDNQVRYSSVGEQQTTEIIKLLYRDANILIFDEPTAVLSDVEIQGFLKMLKEFKELGKTIILITHKLNEVEQVADEVTVLRRGETIKTVPMKKTNKNALADMMVGEKLIMHINNIDDKDYKNRPVVCEIRNLNAYKTSQKHVLALNNLNLDVHQGEILGIAGIEGNGQTELALILGGLLKKRVSGSVKIYDPVHKVMVDALKSSVNQLYSCAGLAHVPEDRLKYGLVLDETVAINSVLPIINKRPFTYFGLINNVAINRYCKEIIYKWDVRGANGGKSLARSLSGGNQQKLVIGRELTREHNLSIFVQPTRGLDLGAIQYVHKKIIEDVKKGRTVILISYELDEILSIATRIVVLDKGKVVFNDLRKKANHQILGRYLSNSALSEQKVVK